jgi:hypothetical protein
MQPVDEVNLGEGLVGALAELHPRLLERHRVRALVPRTQPGEGAEEAAGDADVRGLEADVVVEERAVRVTPLAFAIGEPAQGEQIPTLEQPDAVIEREAGASVELVGEI